MKRLSVFMILLLLNLQAAICFGQNNPVDEYTFRIETRTSNGQAIPATLTITNEKTKKVQRGTLRSGSYTVALPAGTVYRLEATHTGYRPAQKVLELDRVSGANQSQQVIVLTLDREISGESPINVTVIDFETRQLIRQKLNVQVQDFDGRRVIMTGPPREGRFTLLAEFGQRIRFVVETPGYQPYTYTVDVKEQHDITIPLQRFRSPVAQESSPTEAAPSAAASAVTTTPEPATAPPVATTPTPAPVTNTPAPATTPPVASNPEPKPTSPATSASISTDLATLTTGKTVTLNNVYFDQSSYLLRPESYTQLDQLVSLLKSRPDVKIEISGHTDNVGDPRLNLALSENRARVITSYLIKNGIPESRLRYKGYGHTRPLAANDTEENKRKNRRVEVRLLEQ